MKKGTAVTKIRARDQSNFPLRLNEIKDLVFKAAEDREISVNEFILKLIRKELKIK